MVSSPDTRKPSPVPVVSVVIPTWNNEETISESIASVLEQSYTALELIVVNDASPDGTAALLQRIEDPRLKVVTHPVNRGISAARNTGLAASHGDYLAFLDADDYWRPDKLERQLAFMHERGSQVSFTLVDVQNDDGDEQEAARVAAWFNREYPTRAEMVAHFFASGNTLCAAAGLISRSLLDVTGGFCLTALQAQDFDLWMRLLKLTAIEILPERLTVYRQRASAGNLTYDPANAPRIRFEIQQIYRVMFEGMPAPLFDAAFPARRKRAINPADAHPGLEQAFLLLEHSDAAIRYLGLEKLYALLQAPELVEIAAAQYGFTLPDLFALTRSAPSADATKASFDDLRAQLAQRNEEVLWQDEQRRNWEKVAEEREAALAKRDEAIRSWQLLAEERGETIVRYYSERASERADSSQISRQRPGQK